MVAFPFQSHEATQFRRYRSCQLVTSEYQVPQTTQVTQFGGISPVREFLWQSQRLQVR